MFFQYTQNNSGGWDIIDHDNRISKYVIIEASAVKEADEKAKEIGLYFEGVRDGIDCGCCGDRWSSAAYAVTGGCELPSLYGKPIELDIKRNYGFDGYIHYLNGLCQGFYQD